MPIKMINSEEIHCVVELHKSAFPEDYISRTIYASPKVGNYLFNLIKYPTLQKEHFIYGWSENGTLVGYCHYRATMNSWHLNYIAVLPNYQQQGIGKKLWAVGVDEGHRRGFKLITLDVSETNEGALKWYQQEGFVVAEKKWAYEKQLGKGIELIPFENLEVTLDGWEAAETWQSLYGFSQFQLSYSQKTWTVGRLGAYFRLHETIPIHIESVLAKLDFDRKLLFVLPRSSQRVDLDYLECSYRMERKIV